MDLRQDLTSKIAELRQAVDDLSVKEIKDAASAGTGAIEGMINTDLGRQAQAAAAELVAVLNAISGLLDECVCFVSSNMTLSSIISRIC